MSAAYLDDPAQMAALLERLDRIDRSLERELPIAQLDSAWMALVLRKLATDRFAQGNVIRRLEGQLRGLEQGQMLLPVLALTFPELNVTQPVDAAEHGTGVAA